MIAPFLPLLLAATVQAAAPEPDLKPATSAAILAGGKACMGATIDPAGQAGRMAGWADMAPTEVNGQKTEGRVAMRDNVMLVVKTGVDGGCVIVAKPDASFNKPAFLKDLGVLVGAPIATDPQDPKTDLPNGELLIAVVDDTVGKASVELVFANPKGVHAAPKDK